MNKRGAGRWGRGWTNTLALRLFVLIWVALVLSHLAAFAVVHSVAGAGGGPQPGPREGLPPQRQPAGPPMPTFPSLPPTPGLGTPPGPAPHSQPDSSRPDGLPLPALLLDYGVRLLLIAAAAWWGSRWLARPMARLVQASEALVPALAQGRAGPQLDEHQGTREVRAAAAVFNRMATQIQHQFKARGLMIAAISHDLRTPLTRMRLRVEGLPGTLRERCVSDLREMNALIDTVLDLFSPGDNAETRTARTDVAALLQALVDDRADTGQPVTLKPLPLLQVVATTNPLALRRAVGNLVDNALRYGGAAELSLETSLKTDRSLLRIHVCDRGPGIPPDQLARVLQPFVRLDDSRNPATGGVGLGLHIAQELMQRLGGTLTLCNRPEGGLQATLELPLA